MVLTFDYWVVTKGIIIFILGVGGGMFLGRYFYGGDDED